MSEIRVAVVGVGNCASALVQGIALCRSDVRVPSLAHPDLGGYRVSDIHFVAAFDIDARKVGRPLSQAVFAQPNCTGRYVSTLVLAEDPVVSMGHVLDSVPAHLRDSSQTRQVIVADATPTDVAAVLVSRTAHVLLLYLPVGSQQAAELYAEACIRAGVALVNCIPVFIASSETWPARFQERCLPVIGDDVKSQFGATMLHRALAEAMTLRGVEIHEMYQVNVGGNTDFLNLIDHRRFGDKRISKTEAVTSQLRNENRDVHVSSANFVPWLNDEKVCFIRVQGEIFGGAPVTIDVRLQVEDSRNSAGVVIDAIRCARLALDRKIGGVLKSVSAYVMKRPPTQMRDVEAEQAMLQFVSGAIER